MPCDEATMLITKGEYTTLSTWDKIRLKYHNLICPPCQDWQDQNKVISHLNKKEKKYTLSSEKRIEINDSLK